MPRELKRLEKKEKGERGSAHRYIAFAAVAVVLLALVLVFGILPGNEVSRTGEPVAAQQNGEGGQEAEGQGGAAQPGTEITLEQVEVPPLSVYRRRNPFKPLVNMEQLEVEVGGVTGGVVTVPESLEPGLSQESRVVSRAVTLHTVGEEEDKLVAKVSVGEQIYGGLKAGDVFSENFKVLAIGKEGNVTLLYGDERFTVNEGQTVYW